MMSSHLCVWLQILQTRSGGWKLELIGSRLAQAMKQVRSPPVCLFQNCIASNLGFFSAMIVYLPLMLVEFLNNFYKISVSNIHRSDVKIKKNTKENLTPEIYMNQSAQRDGYIPHCWIQDYRNSVWFHCFFMKDFFFVECRHQFAECAQLLLLLACSIICYFNWLMWQPTYSKERMLTQII